MFLHPDRRAPMEGYMENETQPFTHGYDMHEIDTDDFIALCREIGAEPFLTINAAWDSPEVCAAWVEYCNGPAESKYGRLRAQRGHPELYSGDRADVGPGRRGCDVAAPVDRCV